MKEGKMTISEPAIYWYYVNNIQILPGHPHWLSVIYSEEIFLNERLGNWTNEQFINRFKIYGDSSYVNHKVTSGEFQTTMPWTMYSGMNEADLEAIFIYLQSLSPVINQVEKFTPIKVN